MSYRLFRAALLCALASCPAQTWAQSFALPEEQPPRLASAVHPWAKQEVIEDVSPEVLTRLGAVRKQKEQASKTPTAISAGSSAAASAAPAIVPASAAATTPPVAAPNPAPLTTTEVGRALVFNPEPVSRTHASYYVLTPNQRAPRFPYSPGDKFRLFIKDTVDPFALMGEGAMALYNQARGDPHGYGGGMRGYSRRFGAIVGTDFAGEFFGTFLFSSMLHTDPRYFRMEQGNAGRRAGYALTRILVARTDSGGYAFNGAKWLSSLAATAISNTYYPNRRRGFGPTVEKAAINVGFDALSDLFREFWPDIAHRLRIPAFVVRRTADPLRPAQLQKHPSQDHVPGD